MDYEKAMQMFLNVAQLDEACLPGGYGNKAHWFVKRGALLYLYYSQDITDLCLQHSTSSCTCDAGHATPAHQHPLLLAISQMTSLLVASRPSVRLKGCHWDHVWTSIRGWRHHHQTRHDTTPCGRPADAIVGMRRCWFSRQMEVYCAASPSSAPRTTARKRLDVSPASNTFLDAFDRDENTCIVCTIMPILLCRSTVGPCLP